MGSELDYQLQVAHELGYIGPDAHKQLRIQTTYVKRMLSSLIKTVRRPRTDN